MSKGFNLPQFPVEMFAGHIGNFIKEGADALRCPVDFLGVYVLAIMSSGIGNARVIRLKKGWVEPAILYTAAVGDPGTKKSPPFKLATQPVFDMQKEMQSMYRIEKQKYESEILVWENDSNKTSIPKPIKPTLNRNYVNDFTFEALGKLLHANSKGLLMGMDELAGWVNSMDQYRGGKGADRDKWLSLWSCGTTVVDRSSIDEPIIIESPYVNVTGGIQPDRVQCFKGKQHDGFLSRVLMTFPEPIEDRWVDVTVSQGTLDNYKSCYDNLYKLEPKVLSDNSIEPIALNLSDQAKRIFVDYFNKCCADIQDEHQPYLKAAFVKLKAYSARLALVIQLMTSPESSCIDKEAMEMAVILSEYFKAHTRKIYAFLNKQKINGLEIRALETLKAHDGKMTLREFYTKKVAGCADRKSALQFFKNLEKRGLGKISEIKNPSGGRATIYFQLSNFSSAISNQT